MFKCSQVPFIGHLLTREGLKPDPWKVEAICNMSKPEDVQAVQHFVNKIQDSLKICLICLSPFAD